MAINNPVIADADIIQDTAVAIQEKDHGGKMEFPDIPSRIRALPSPTPAKSMVNFYDFKGNLAHSYTAAEAEALTELPEAPTIEGFTFQKWNWSLANIKTWIQNHGGGCLDVGAIYTTTDGQDHNYWGNPRLNTATTINMQKRGKTSIGDNAFRGCFSLTQINIPDGVTSIGGSAFLDCYSLTQINIPDSVTGIGGSAFQDCFSLTKINIPDSVTGIGDNAFRGCFSLTQINIPDGVTSIGSNAFQNCYSLTQINIPDSATSIGDSVFRACPSLTQINIPDGVTSIGSNAFFNCKALCDILLESKPTLASANAFTGLPINYRIYVPRVNLSWFETATNWSTIYTQRHIVAIEDYIEYLESIGFNVDKYKEVTV